MKIEILKVENGKIVEPEDDMPACIMGGCGGGGGWVCGVCVCVVAVNAKANCSC